MVETVDEYERIQAMYMVATLGLDFERAIARGVPDTPKYRATFAKLQADVADIKARGGVVWGFDSD